MAATSRSLPQQGDAKMNVVVSVKCQGVHRWRCHVTKKKLPDVRDPVTLEAIKPLTMPY